MPRHNKGYHLARDPRTGYWHVRWFKDGRRHTRTTGTRDGADAQRFLAAFLVEIGRGDLVPEPTVADILHLYVEHSRARHSHLQIASKCRAVAGKMGWLRPSEIRAAQCRTYARQRAAQGIAPGTIRSELGKLGAALAWAHAEGILHHAPPPLTLPKAPPPRNRWLTRDEVERLIAAAKSPHVRLFILLAIHTGGRKEALLTLTWDRVDLNRRIIDLGYKEGGKPRAVVPFGDRLAAALAEAREMATTPYVVEYGGKKVRLINKTFNAVVARAGIPHCTIHDMRRSAGSWMIQAGVPLELIAAFLGHASIRVTERVYAKLLSEHLRSAAKALEG